MSAAMAKWWRLISRPLAEEERGEGKVALPSSGRGACSRAAEGQDPGAGSDLSRRAGEALRPCPSVEDGDGAAVLRPARDIVAHRHRPLLAVGDRADAGSWDAASGKIVAHHLGAAAAEREIVFARAALVGVALDQEG